MPKIRYPAEGDATLDVAVGTTILDASRALGIPNGSACGGVCACSSCHVRVVNGATLLSPPEDDELDMLDHTFDARPESRLACQARVLRDGVVEVALTAETVETYANEHPSERARIAERIAALRKR
jgi:2Fe-2S ferredoxin